MKALIILSLLGVVAMLSEVFHFRKMLLPLMVTGLIAALGTLFVDWGEARSYYNDMVLFDNYALSFSGLIIVITLLWLLMGGSFFSDSSNRAEHAALVIFCLAGAVSMLAFSDLTMFFVGLEILSVCLYVLAASRRHDVNSNEAGLKYFLMGAFATGFLLFGMALIYGACGTFNTNQIAMKLAESTADLIFVQTGVILVLAGLLFKISAVPFHFWAPDVYEGAPTPVTALMATVVKTTAIAAFFRLFNTSFSTLYSTWAPIVAVLSAATMLTGNILAVYQSNLKRMLAYSSVAHAGYLMMALVTVGDGSAASIFFYTAAYSLGSLGLFAIVQSIENSSRDQRIEAVAGLLKNQPVAGGALILLLFSLAGIPPMGGFLAKYMVFTGAISSGYLWLTLLAVLSSLIGVFYYFRVIYAMLKAQQSPAGTGSLIVGINISVLMVAAALLSTAFGVLPALAEKILP